MTKEKKYVIRADFIFRTHLPNHSGVRHAILDEFRLELDKVSCALSTSLFKSESLQFDGVYFKNLKNEKSGGGYLYLRCPHCDVLIESDSDLESLEDNIEEEVRNESLPA